jgi:Arc/MetJ family transcription regulator
MGRRMTLVVDPDLLRQAQEILHTSSPSETVHQALCEVVALRRRVALLDMELSDLTPDALAHMRWDRLFGDG